MKRWWVGALAAGLCLFAFAACQRVPTGNVQAAVEITLADGTGVHQMVTVQGGKTAKDVFEQICKAEDIAYRLEDGRFDGFYGMDADDVDEWVFYVSGRRQRRLPEKVIVQKNDLLAYRYERRK